MTTPREKPASAAAEAIRAGRPAVARSLRLHRPRGPICGRGYCGMCEVETDAGRALACETSALLARAPDPLRPLGLAGERLPPWFWERRFLRPRRLQRMYLHALRHLSAAGRLPLDGPRSAPRDYVEEELETAVVGEAGNVRGLVLGVYDDRVLGVLRPNALVAVSFERLVLETGAYERIPPVRGNDLPGVIGLRALERYAGEGAIGPGTRIAAWGPPERVARVRAAADAHGARVVWSGDEAPRALLGHGRLRAVDVGRRVPCDLFVVAAAQPALELALQAGARARLTQDELPVLVAAELPPWLELRGAVAATASGVPAVAAQDEAFACLCEDVRVRDVRRAIAEGFDHPELVKRRTGALTGPCQGKLCAPTVLSLLREAGRPHEPTTQRPLARPATLGELAAHA